MFVCRNYQKATTGKCGGEPFCRNSSTSIYAGSGGYSAGRWRVSRIDTGRLIGLPAEQARQVTRTAEYLLAEFKRRHVDDSIDVNGLRGAILGKGITGEYPNG